MTATENATLEDTELARLALEPQALRRIPRDLALRHDVLAISCDGNHIAIAIPDALDRDVVERVRFATGMHVRAVAANSHMIRARLLEAYPHQSAARSDISHAPPCDDAPAVTELDEIHRTALETMSSDVHLEPLSEGGRVRHRLDGVLCQTKTFSAQLYGQIVSRVKLLAGMDIADRRQPQDGCYVFEIGGRSMDVRVSSIPTIAGEKLALRLFSATAQTAGLEDLGMSGPDLKRIRALVHAPHGFLIVCGPTGSGKTTTLYAALSERNAQTQNLCSVEDPVETRIPGIAQVQVSPRAGVTFASAVRAFLRQDPNVIMVGEMRDEETACVAASASLSGSLVLTSLHANDATKAVDRLVELGASRHAIAAGLTGVVAQRLVRRLCTSCRRSSRARERAPYQPIGCGTCRGTGYSGRLAIFEYLFVDEPMRALIASGGSSLEIAQLAKRNGYEPMLADGVRRVQAGETSEGELRRVLGAETAE